MAKLGEFQLRDDMTIGTPLHDPLALALAIDKTLTTTTVPMYIEIDTRSGLTNGASIFNSALTREHIVREGDHLTDAGEEPVTPNADVPTVIASDRFLSLLMTRLTAGTRAPSQFRIAVNPLRGAVRASGKPRATFRGHPFDASVSRERRE